MAIASLDLTRAIGTVSLVDFRTEVGVFSVFLPQSIQVELGQGDFRPHQNDQFGPHLCPVVLRKILPQQGADQDMECPWCFSFGILNQSAQDNRAPIRRGHVGANVAGVHGRNGISADIYIAVGTEAVDLLQNIERDFLLRIDQGYDLQL